MKMVPVVLVKKQNGYILRGESIYRKMKVMKN
jgi:hypothetical protein